MDKFNIEKVSYLFLGWISFIIITLTILLTHQIDDSKMFFYKFGPSDNLIIMGISINTPIKYFMVVIFSFVNSAFRSLSHNFLTSWIINNIQDDKSDKSKLNKRVAYQVSIINIVYTWVDWLLYMNILLSQIDMLIYEIIADIIVSTICNRYYLNKKNNKINHDMNDMNDMNDINKIDNSDDSILLNIY
jgi:hypothetical protein